MKALILGLVFIAGVVIGGGVIWWKISNEYWDQLRWDQLVRVIQSQPSRIPKQHQTLVVSHNDFPAASIACIKDARKLLRINQISTGDVVDLGSTLVWERKAVLFVSSVDATQQPYVFMCLLDGDLKLERTRLVYPQIGSDGNDPVVEIGTVQFLDTEF